MSTPAQTQTTHVASDITSAELTGLSNPTLAFNLSTAVDWMPGLQFLDLMKIVRPWIGHEPGQWGGMTAEDLQAEGYVDAAGWPTEIPAHLEKIGTIWQWAKHSESVEDRAGIYVVNYDGEGDLRIEGDVQLLPSEDDQLKFLAKGSNIYLNIYDTDPKGTGDHLRNITIVKEEHVALHEAGAVFNPDWLELISDARELRFMDWMHTNNSKVQNWEDWGTAESGPSRMVALEHMVQLANEIGADAWFTIPHQADETFIRNFATYVRDNLDPNLKVKVEYSNEVWNFAFQQTHWLLEQSRDEWGVDAHVDYHAKKAVETALIWEEVFGDEADARLINVLGSQTANSWITKRLLDPVIWRENEPDTYVDPASIFEEIAVTTYFGSATISNPDLRSELLAQIDDPEVDAMAYLFERLQDPDYKQSIPQIHAALQEHAALAETYGLKLTSYEGGQHVHHSFAVRDLSEEDVAILTEFMTEFVRSSYMTELYEMSWQSWAEVSDGPYMQFGDMVRPSQWGSWGVFESLDTITERGQTLIDLNETTTAWWDGAEGGSHYQSGVTTLGSAEGDTFHGTAQEDYLIGLEGNDIFHISGGNDGLNGGDGMDRAIFDGTIADHVITQEGAGYRVEGPNGRDFLIHIEEIAFTDGAVLRLDALNYDEEGQFGTSQDPETTPSEETDASEPDDTRPEDVEETETRLVIEDTEAVGYEVQAINAHSTVGKNLNLNISGETAFAVYERGATAEVADVQITGNYWTINGNQLGRDSEALTDNPLESALALGDIHIGVTEITTGDGSDHISGRETDEIFSGGGGRDVLIGRGGEDTLSGDAGNDWLSGGQDNDRLTGGTGADRFVFGSGDGEDMITDFETEDIIELRGFLKEGQTLETALSYDGTSLILSNGTDIIRLADTTQEDLSWVYDQITLA